MSTPPKPLPPPPAPFTVHYDAKGKAWSDDCLRCGWKWLRRKASKPVVCPKCTNPYYDRPRVNAPPRRASDKDAGFYFIEKTPPKPRKRKR